MLVERRKTLKRGSQCWGDAERGTQERGTSSTRIHDLQVTVAKQPRRHVQELAIFPASTPANPKREIDRRVPARGGVVEIAVQHFVFEVELWRECEQNRVALERIELQSLGKSAYRGIETDR